MSAPIYTPFFVHPTTTQQKKRASGARKRVSYTGGSTPNEQQQPQQQQSDSQDGFGSIIDTRSRRPTSANGNGECLLLPEEGPQTIGGTISTRVVKAPAKRLMMLHSLRCTNISLLHHHQQQQPPPHKRSRMTILLAPAASGSSNQMQQPPQSHELAEEHGLDDIAAEVEVNVEDDTEESAPPPSHHHHHHHSIKSSSTISSFDPDSCFDSAELRRQLHAAYDRIHQLYQQQQPPQLHPHQEQQRLKTDNYYLRNELSQCEQRISQLESIVLERNMRLKQLLSENVFLSARLKRIQSEFGVDAVKEIFNRE